ncbi:MAG: hypothetical protein HY827_04485 [Actinobacteria bacterium]|nr:hypothetical protein [Actinomycetota bacterium]
MKLPIDTTGMMFMCATGPEPVLDFETKAPKADENGEPLYGVQVVTISEAGAEVINVKTPGQPRVKGGQAVSVHGLVATPWSMGDRAGVAFRASKIEAAAKAGESRA